ncbi:MAG: BamA/TamA family outer membrane protein, partial [Pseudomonadales bacterium]
LAKWVDLHATGDEDVVEVTRLSDERLQLSMWRAGAEGRKVGNVPYLTRVFRRDETREIRLYLDGVADSVAIRGEGTQRIKLRIIANRGEDVVYPPTSPETDVYDQGDEPTAVMATIIQPRFGGHFRLDRTPTSVSHSCTAAPRRPADDLRAPTRDWGTAWLPIPALGYVSGLGVYAGVGVSKTDYAFQRYPFKAQHALWGGYASTPNSFFAEYFSDFRRVVGPFGAFLGAGVTGVANPEFYGIGNETTSDQPDSFYQIDQIMGIVTPLVTLNPKAYTQIAAGMYYQRSRTPLGTGNIIDALQPLGAGDVNEVGLTTYVKFDSYNNSIATPTGIQLNFNGQLGFVATDSVYGTLAVDALGFTTTDRLPGNPTLAVRIGAQKNLGAYPFYSAAYLGGTDNLKGYAPNRFAGDASIYLNSELRLFLTEIRWPIPTNFGILGIADVGRVFVTGQASNVWHTGFGGGIWFGLLRSGQGLNLALVDGESLRLYISTGFILKKKRIF